MFHCQIIKTVLFFCSHDYLVILKNCVSALFDNFPPWILESLTYDIRMSHGMTAPNRSRASFWD